MSINNKVPSDATLRRSGGGSGMASKGPAASERVPVDSTKRFGAKGGGPVKNSSSFYDQVDNSTSRETSDHDNSKVSSPMAGSMFKHDKAPSYQK